MKLYFAIVIMTGAVLLVLTLAAPMEVNAFSVPNEFKFAFTCSAGENDQLWIILLCFYVFSTLLWGCYLSFQIRNVDSLFNESKVHEYTRILEDPKSIKM